MSGAVLEVIEPGSQVPLQFGRCVLVEIPALVRVVFEIVEFPLAVCVPDEEVSGRPDGLVIGYGARVWVTVPIPPVLYEEGASSGGRARRKEWPERAAVHKARRSDPGKEGEGGCQIVV